jgi:hypothetical protein
VWERGSGLKQTSRAPHALSKTHTRLLGAQHLPQVDDQLPGSPHPVVLIPLDSVGRFGRPSNDPLLYFALVSEPGRRRGMLYCPCLVARWGYDLLARAGWNQWGLSPRSPSSSVYELIFILFLSRSTPFHLYDAKTLWPALIPPLCLPPFHDTGCCL